MTERLRILHCLRAPVGGLFRHVLDLSAEQAARGNAVGIVVDSTTADPLTESKLAGAEQHLALGISRVPMSRLPGIGDARAASAVADVARRLEADVLHGHGAKGGAYARIAARLMRLRGQRPVALYTPHGGSLHFPAGSAQASLYIGLEKLLARITDGLIFESDYIRRAYEERVGRDLAPARVITNALRPSDFTTHAPAADAADFLFIGELRLLKGVDVLLRALAAVARRRRVSAVIVGEGPDRVQFERLSVALGLRSMVTFTGAMPAQQAFARGRCIVVPSRAESLPFIVMEAAAAGVPIIATNVGGIPEVVAGADALLVPADDAAALAAAMHDLLDAPQAAAARAKRLKQSVAERFAAAPMADATLRFYAELLGR